MGKFIVENWEGIAALFGTAVSFFVGRKSKKNTETSGELENIKVVREIEKDLLTDMRERVTELIAIGNEQEILIGVLRKRLEECNGKCSKLIERDSLNRGKKS